MTLRGSAGLIGAVEGLPARVRVPEPAASLKSLLPNIAQDQKRIWLFPLKAARGEKGWKSALGILGAAAGLIALERHNTPYFQRPAFQKAPAVREFNRFVSGRNAALAIAAVPVSFYLAGLLRQIVNRGGQNGSYARQTALLAGEAIASAEIVAAAMKAVGRRIRPSLVAQGGDYSDTWFRQRGTGSLSSGSFPSAHTTAAFAVATVFAQRYRSHRWAPWVAYGLAGVIGYSRVSGQAHFPSDVFMGAALGFSISHFVVLDR